MHTGITHYSLCSSMGADPKGLFLYTRTKGLVEQDIGNLNYPQYSVFRPGVLLNRDNDKRFIESVISVIPFISKIEARDLALAMRLDAEKHFTEKLQGKIVYENSAILKLLPKKEKK